MDNLVGRADTLMVNLEDNWVIILKIDKYGNIDLSESKNDKRTPLFQRTLFLKGIKE